MSVANIIREMGADVALVNGKVKLSCLDRLLADVVEQVLSVARVHREELVQELEASAPALAAFDTGLGWLPGNPCFDHPDHDGWWAAFDLADLCVMLHMRVVRAGERILVVYPPSLELDLIDYATDLLDDARAFLRRHLDCLPVLTPPQAVLEIKRIMVAHPRFGFMRDEAGSLWPMYPKKFRPSQKQVLQSLWFVASTSLDEDDFEDTAIVKR